MKNAGLILTLFLLPLASFAQEAARPVVSEIVTPQSGLRQSWVGTVTARIETDLGFPRSGTLATRPASLGDVVAKDQVLAVQDPQDLDSSLRSAQAGVIVAESQANSARNAANRVQALVTRGVDSEAALQSATAQLAAAEASLEQAKANLVGAENARNNAVLHAPQDGVVTQVFAEPGATLTAGAPVLRLAGTQDREVIIDLSEGDVAGLATGSVFRVRLEANMALEATTRLTSIDPVATRETRTRQLRLALDENAPTGFRLGALVQVEPMAETAAQLSLPVTAIIANSEPPQVWRVDPAGREARLVTIETGATAGTRVLVLNGLSDGDEIIVKGVNSIEDGQIVGPRVQE
ncbi:efflux RND transporter periplasmic adaptor subunit [Pseudorhodobacter sp. W20_MBD10_FR17]|uniref:efflux RND transporter periplasmic adaptor subunit n=1 Tax=Pseudorhodobacter sp. W20_MBD10_FR17 TaxID=3240266 RepID=UPI003F945FCB